MNNDLAKTDQEKEIIEALLHNPDFVNCVQRIKPKHSSIVLDVDEVEEISGKTRKTAMIKALKSMGIHYEINAMGRVIVPRKHAEDILAGNDQIDNTSQIKRAIFLEEAKDKKKRHGKKVVEPSTKLKIKRVYWKYGQYRYLATIEQAEILGARWIGLGKTSDKVHEALSKINNILNDVGGCWYDSDGRGCLYRESSYFDIAEGSAIIPIPFENEFESIEIVLQSIPS